MLPAGDRAAARERLAARRRAYEARLDAIKPGRAAARLQRAAVAQARPVDERQTVARWLSHTALLLMVVFVPAIGGLVGAHAATGHAAGLADSVRAADAPTSGTLTARGFIVKPAGLGQTAQSHREVITYTVQDGDVLGAIGERYGLRIDTLRQTNSLADVDRLALGQQLLIPPTNGVLVKVAKGDTVPTLAQQYHADAASIIGYNAIRNPVQLAQGTFVMIPDGTGFTASQDAGSSPAQDAPAAPAAPDAIPHSGSAYNHFPWGQCTYYVASRRNIPWNGNAWQWFGAAQSYGMATGSRPRPGAIMVTWESRYYGHVAIVEAVYSDGSYLISEMNYRGLGIVDQRHIIPGQVPLIGFIYQ